MSCHVPTQQTLPYGMQTTCKGPSVRLQATDASSPVLPASSATQPVDSSSRIRTQITYWSCTAASCRSSMTSMHARLIPPRSKLQTLPQLATRCHSSSHKSLQGEVHWHCHGQHQHQHGSICPSGGTAPQPAVPWLCGTLAEPALQSRPLTSHGLSLHM